MIRPVHPDAGVRYHAPHPVRAVFCNENNALADQPAGRRHAFQIKRFGLPEPVRVYN